MLFFLYFPISLLDFIYILQDIVFVQHMRERRGDRLHPHAFGSSRFRHRQRIHRSHRSATPVLLVQRPRNRVGFCHLHRRRLFGQRHQLSLHRSGRWRGRPRHHAVARYNAVRAGLSGRHRGGLSPCHRTTTSGESGKHRKRWIVSNWNNSRIYLVILDFGFIFGILLRGSVSFRGGSFQILWGGELFWPFFTFGLMQSRQSHRSHDPSIDWLIDWLICLLIHRLIDWLIESWIIDKFVTDDQSPHSLPIFFLGSIFLLTIHGWIRGGIDVWCGAHFAAFRLPLRSLRLPQPLGPPRTNSSVFRLRPLLFRSVLSTDPLLRDNGPGFHDCCGHRMELRPVFGARQRRRHGHGTGDERSDARHRRLQRRPRRTAQSKWQSQERNVGRCDGVFGVVCVGGIVAGRRAQRAGLEDGTAAARFANAQSVHGRFRVFPVHWGRFGDALSPECGHSVVWWVDFPPTNGMNLNGITTVTLFFPPPGVFFLLPLHTFFYSHLIGYSMDFLLLFFEWKIILIYYLLLSWKYEKKSREKNGKTRGRHLTSNDNMTHRISCEKTWQPINQSIERMKVLDLGITWDIAFVFYCFWLPASISRTFRLMIFSRFPIPSLLCWVDGEVVRLDRKWLQWQQVPWPVFFYWNIF